MSKAVCQTDNRDFLERIAVALEQIAGHIGDASVREDFPNSAAALDGDEPMTVARLEELKAAAVADFDQLIAESRPAERKKCDWCGRVCRQRFELFHEERPILICGTCHEAWRIR